MKTFHTSPHFFTVVIDCVYNAHTALPSFFRCSLIDTLIEAKTTAMHIWLFHFCFFVLGAVSFPFRSRSVHLIHVVRVRTHPHIHSSMLQLSKNTELRQHSEKAHKTRRISALFPLVDIAKFVHLRCVSSSHRNSRFSRCSHCSLEHRARDQQVSTLSGAIKSSPSPP